MCRCGQKYISTLNWCVLTSAWSLCAANEQHIVQHNAAEGNQCPAKTEHLKDAGILQFPYNLVSLLVLCLAVSPFVSH